MLEEIRDALVWLLVLAVSLTPLLAVATLRGWRWNGRWNGRWCWALGFLGVGVPFGLISRSLFSTLLLGLICLCCERQRRGLAGPFGWRKLARALVVATALTAIPMLCLIFAFRTQRWALANAALSAIGLFLLRTAAVTAVLWHGRREWSPTFREAPGPAKLLGGFGLIACLAAAFFPWQRMYGWGADALFYWEMQGPIGYDGPIGIPGSAGPVSLQALDRIAATALLLWCFQSLWEWVMCGAGRAPGRNGK